MRAATCRRSSACGRASRPAYGRRRRPDAEPVITQVWREIRDAMRVASRQPDRPWRVIRLPSLRPLLLGRSCAGVDRRLRAGRTAETTVVVVPEADIGAVGVEHFHREVVVPDHATAAWRSLPRPSDAPLLREMRLCRPCWRTLVARGFRRPRMRPLGLARRAATGFGDQPGCSVRRAACALRGRVRQDLP